jgi:hypothetical protein
MPCAAFGDKKYFAGTFTCKICDNEHAAAALRDSEVLSVKSSPCDVTRPAFEKRGEDISKVSSIV